MGLVVEAYDSATSVVAKTGTDGTFMMALPHAGTFSLRVTRDKGDMIVFAGLPVATDSLVQRVFPIPVGRAYYEFEVEHVAAERRTMAHPDYPEALRQINVEGDVLVQYVVEPTGRVREGSFKRLSSTHALFTEAVKVFLSTMEYTPATIRGVAVAQLVQQPFTFRLR